VFEFITAIFVYWLDEWSWITFSVFGFVTKFITFANIKSLLSPVFDILQKMLLCLFFLTFVLILQRIFFP